MIDSTYEDKCYRTPTFAGAVRKLQTNGLRNTVMLRLLEVADLCSRTVSNPANRLLKRTDSEGSSSVAEKKSSAVPLFRSGHMLAICAGLSSKGKAGVQRGRKTAGCPSFLPTAVGTASSPRRVPRRSRRPQTANPPAESQRKTLRPLGTNTLTQFVHPGFPVQKRSRPLGANTLTQFAYPAIRCQECPTALLF